MIWLLHQRRAALGRSVRRLVRRVLTPLLLAAAGMTVIIMSAHATTVSFDTTAAHAMLSALGNPALTPTQALGVAHLRGNQGIVRKLQEFGIAASTEGFARAIYDAAHGTAVTDNVERSYLLDIVKGNAPAIGRLLDRIDHDPAQFQQAIEARIAQFTPKDADIHLQGFVVAGGDGGGYAFGSTDFYLNAGIVHDLVLARAITNHEMYHAVQGYYSVARGMYEGDPDASACHATQRLFDNLYEEGTAVVVEDQSLVAQSDDPIAHRKLTDIADGVRHVDNSAALLEMSVDALSATPRMPFHEVYAVDFYGHAVLYSIGFVMAKALVSAVGPDGLIRLLRESSPHFVLAYLGLPQYGRDEAHPKLGPHTIAAAKALVSGCP